MRYQKIYTQIWNDEKFVELSPAAQRFFLYLLTAPNSNLIGMYILKDGYACDDLRCSQKDFQKLLAEVLQQKLISYDEKHKVILIKNYLKHNPITNPNQLKAAIKILSSLPKTYLLQELKGIIEGLQEGLTKGLLKGILYSVTASDSVSDTDSVKEKGSMRGKDEIPYKEIIEDLNEQSGKQYRVTGSSKELITARWKEGFTLEDFQRVHLNMAVKWKNDPAMNQYLRPSTLYQASKFESYLNAEPTLSDRGKVSRTTEKNLAVFEHFIQEGKENG